MYGLCIKPEADKTFKKLSKKNKTQLKIINKKILEIRQQPHHTYKWLRKPLQNLNRIHIDKHFVLIFRINHTSKIVEVLSFNHHDNICKKKEKS